MDSKIKAILCFVFDGVDSRCYFVNWSKGQNKSIGGVFSGVKVLTRLHINVLVLNKFLHFDAVQEQMLGNSYAQFTGLVEDFGPLQDSLDIILYAL